MLSFRFNVLALCVAAAAYPAIASDDHNKTDTTHDVETIVVTGTPMTQPLVVSSDTKLPRQPIPAHDGADYLKTMAGFNVIRKGGADGDATFRGMAGSRLNILSDGSSILGGCNNRMDAPTAYIFPEVYDRLTLIKGPQTVLYGAGNSAATVLFERQFKPFTTAGMRGYAGVLVGSNGRTDTLIDGSFGSSFAYAQFIGSYSRADDYQDGDGQSVHSEYERYSGNGAFGWTPDENTRVEFGVVRSDGEAAYADRAMDGTQFLREASTLSVVKSDITSWLNRVELNWFDSRVDHIMDDQTLRTPGMMGYADLLRDMQGGRAKMELELAPEVKLTGGFDHEKNQHDSRSAGVNGMYMAWKDDAQFKQSGVFAEVNWATVDAWHYIAGLRQDSWFARDERATTGGMMPMPNPSYNHTRDEKLNSYFARAEYHGDGNGTWYMGWGHNERFPDYWELIAKQSATSVSAFDIDHEETSQWDLGWIIKSARYDFSISLFRNHVDHFILVDYSNPMKMTGFVRNIDAESYGSEMEMKYRLSDTWVLDGTLAYTRGNNLSDDKALAQVSPLEARIALNYDNKVWSVGGLLRAVDDQNRVDIGRGNIVGKDIAPSAGFIIASLNAAYRFNDEVSLSAGIDNVFDKTYAEFVSRAGGNGMGGSIPGYTQTTRVNEPGRVVWSKLSWYF